MKKMHRLVAAMVASCALFAAGGVAAAAEPESIVDTTKTGSIHLTKYDDAAGSTVADGSQTPPTANPIQGIEFTLTPINGVTVDSNEGLKAAAGLTATSAAKFADTNKGFTLGEAKKATTSAEGKIDWSGLPLGAYLLEETNSKVGDKTYTAAAPSIIFLPTTDPANQSSWLEDENGYAVWVYPKNSLKEVKKSVADAGKQAGDDVTFTVTSSIPGTSANEKISDFAFYDTVDPKLDINGKESTVTVKVGETTLTKDTDFVVLITDGGQGGQDKLFVGLTTAGRDKAKAAKTADSAAQAVMTFDAKVLASGVVPNQAQVYSNIGSGESTTVPGDTPPDNPPTPPEGTQKTNTTTSAWGKVDLLKTDQNGEAIKNNPAEFQVYQCSADGKLSGNPIAVNGNTTFTTDAEGKLTIDGLHVNNYADDAAVAETHYCLVETKAPTGFELRQEPIPFQVTLTGFKSAEETYKYDANGVLISYSNNSAEWTAKVADAESLTYAQSVVNIPVKPKLPLTGGAGIAVFGLLGALVIGGGLYAAKRNARSAA